VPFVSMQRVLASSGLAPGHFLLTLVPSDPILTAVSHAYARDSTAAESRALDGMLFALEEPTEGVLGSA